MYKKNHKFDYSVRFVLPLHLVMLVGNLYECIGTTFRTSVVTYIINIGFLIKSNEKFCFKLYSKGYLAEHSLFSY